jgi:hypothetical protein
MTSRPSRPDSGRQKHLSQLRPGRPGLALAAPLISSCAPYHWGATAVVTALPFHATSADQVSYSGCGAGKSSAAVPRRRRRAVPSRPSAAGGSCAMMMNEQEMELLLGDGMYDWDADDSKSTVSSASTASSSRLPRCAVVSFCRDGNSVHVRPRALTDTGLFSEELTAAHLTPLPRPDVG